MVSQSYKKNLWLCSVEFLWSSDFYMTVIIYGVSVMSKICDCVALNFYDPVIFTRLCHYLLQVKWKKSVIAEFLWSSDF